MKLTYHIGEDEIPSRDEGPDLSDCHVAVQVRRARLGNTGAKFCIAQASQHGGQRSDEETEDNSGSCLLSGDLASEYVDTSAECGAHPQSDEVQGG